MTSFIKVEPNSDFSYQNLPYGVFSTTNNERHRIGVAIGNYVLDLSVVFPYFTGPLMKEIALDVFTQTTLNKFMSLTPEHWRETRQYVKYLLSSDTPHLRDDKKVRKMCLFPMNDCVMHVPAKIGDFTDFYASIYHANNFHQLMMRGFKGLPPLENFRLIPLGNPGRASSVIVSGTPVARPVAQARMSKHIPPSFGPSQALDFELEVGCLVGGPPTKVGQPLKIENAEKHLFGLVLLNDWTARDVHKWEYMPLGSFTAKIFATTISPWVVTFEALNEFRVQNFAQNPVPWAYLRHDDHFNFDINLEVYYRPRQLSDPSLICRSNFRHLYWTLKQMLVHLTVSGCNINPGDLFGTGVVSGPQPESFGTLIELTASGIRPFVFEHGILRTYIENGDEIIMRGFCQGNGYRVGFGECSGFVLPSNLLI